MSHQICFIFYCESWGSFILPYAIPFFVHMNLRLFSFLKHKHWLKWRRLILVRLSLIKMRALGWSLLWACNQCWLLKTASLILLEQNRAMMVGCRLLSEAGDSLCDKLISLADRSTCKTLETPITSWSVFSLSSQDSPWNSRHSWRPYCSMLLISSSIWPDAAWSLRTLSSRSWFSMRCVFTSSCVEWRCFFISSYWSDKNYWLFRISLISSISWARVLLFSTRVWHLVKFSIDVFDINFRCRSIHASQQHSGWDEQYYKSETNRSQPVQTDDGSRKQVFLDRKSV